MSVLPLFLSTFHACFGYRIPRDCIDVHALRTLKQQFAKLLTGPEIQRIQNRARESIPEVIYALNMTFQDVEECWEVWRHDRVRGVLHSGFTYIRNRISSACWRRKEGRLPASFQGVYPAFHYVGKGKIQPDNQPWEWPPSAGAGPSTYQHEVHDAITSASSIFGNPQVQTAYQHPTAKVSSHHGVHASHTGAQTAYQHPVTKTSGHSGVHAAHTVAQTGYEFYQTPHQSQSPTSPHPHTPSIVGKVFPPPPGPPPPRNLQQQQPQPQPPPHPLPLPPTRDLTPALLSPQLSPEVATAIEVATRYLEAVNKAVNIFIELNVL
ncbi:hypothetical protein BGW80DRAFT_1213807 [Lactifluus volemus]|nr:hypothetical protein BGW80DRAFT_1213807 [Lactifluus volemus]